MMITGRSVRKQFEAFGKLNAKEAIQDITPSLDHDISNLRKEAAAALGEIADPSAISALESTLRTDPDVRKNIRWALGQIVIFVKRLSPVFSQK